MQFRAPALFSRINVHISYMIRKYRHWVRCCYLWRGR